MIDALSAVTGVIAKEQSKQSKRPSDSVSASVLKVVHDSESKMIEHHEETLEAIRRLQAQELSIIRLSEPLAISQSQPLSARKRASDASISTDPFDSPSPASLAADLSHYKELFSKLRFSYLEQVTKEKFLRSIVGDPPLIVEQSENVELEAKLVEVKASLKAQKGEMATMVEELEAKGRDLSRRYEAVTLQTTHLSSLPKELSSLSDQLETLLAQRSTQQKSAPASTTPSQSLPLPATLSLLESHCTTLSDLDAELQALHEASAQKNRDLEKLRRELKPLGVRRDDAVRKAIDAKEKGGVGGEMEVMGRWYRGIDNGLREMLGVK